jgi:NADPH:quinone reductase-like Zn-dependent oxidoreductase
MLQVVVQKTPSSAKLAAVETPNPTPRNGEAVVEVHSISLNRGEVSAAFQRAEDGWRPGWDFAGTIAQAAADGSGPRAGTRVVGFLESAAWAQRISVDARNLAPLPDSMSFEVASTLPIAGLTALYALEKGGALLGKEVLITGATGGMGQFAVQLALLAGASVTAAVYRNTMTPPAGVSADRFRVVRTDESGLAQLRERRYDLVVEGVGGEVFGAAVESLAPGGTIVTLGATRDLTASFNIRQFFKIGRARIYGFSIFDEVLDKPAAQGLATLIRLIEAGRLTVPLTYTGSVSEVDRIARDLLDSKIPGKAVLRWNGGSKGD